MISTKLVKILIGLFLGFVIGLCCRLAGVPSPAPLALMGAVLVLAMTLGWTLMDQWAAHRSKQSEVYCGGPTGEPAVSVEKPE